MSYFARFLIVFSLLSQNIYAQQYKVDWGPENRKEGSLFSSFRLVGLTDDSYHLVMRPRKSNTLLSFNLNHRLTDNRAINFQFNRKDLQLTDFAETQAGHFAYFTEYDKRNNLWSLFVSPFTNGEFGEIHEVYQHPIEGHWKISFWSDSNRSTYLGDDLSVSLDGSKVSFAKTLNSREEKNAEAYALSVFDAEFNLLWKKIQIFQVDGQKIKFLQSVVSNDGSIYILARLSEGSALFRMAEDRDGLPRYDYKVFKVTEDDLETFDIELEKGMAPQYAGIYLPDGDSDNLVVGGFYTTNERHSGLKGLFLNSIKFDTKTISSSIYPLEDDFLEGLISNRDAKKDRGLNSNFRIKDFLQFNDGSFGFVAEEFYITTMSHSTGSGRSTTSYTYNTNQIVIPRFSAQGELVNIQKIDKSFRSENASIISYSLALTNGNIYLVYNDNKKGSERRELRGKGRDGGRYTDMTIIDENGTITYQETLFSSREIDMAYLPSQSDFSNTHLLLLAVKGKRYKCGLISLDE